MSYYAGQPPQQQQQQAPPQSRTRSKSTAAASGGGQFTRDGRHILEFGKYCFVVPSFINPPNANMLQTAKAMYPYQKAIPEELSFRKGDVLAVLKYQDDGWYEAEVSGGPGGRGLVPSNYLGKL